MRPRRHGFTLVEMIVTAVLLSAVFAAVVPLLQQVNIQRRAAEQRQFALEEAANILERFTAHPWDAVTAESAAQVTLSEEAPRLLRDPELTLTVIEASPQPTARRITVELRWKNRAGDFVAPVRLTTWIYRHEERP